METATATATDAYTTDMTECSRCGTDLTDDIVRHLDAGGPSECSRCGLELPPLPAEWLAENGYEASR